MDLYVMCGLPASGKTTLAKQLAEQHHAVVHSYDDISTAWETPDKDGEFCKQWFEGIKEDLRKGNSVICDSLALNAISRKHILANLSDFDCTKILIVKVVPVEECVKRNKNRIRKVTEDRIKQCAWVLECPTTDEGWDEIIISKD